MTWLILASTAAVLFSLNSLLGRVLAVKSQNPRAFAFVYNLFGALFALGLWFLHPQPISNVPPLAWQLLVLSIILYGVFNRFEFYARKHVESSTLSILTKFIPVITFTLSIVIWKETVTLNKLLAAALIIGGTMAAVYKKGRIEFNQGLKYAAIIIVSLGLAWTVDKKASSYFPLALYAFATYLPPNIFLLPFPFLKWSQIVTEIKLANWKIAFLAFVNMTAYYTLISAFQYGEASKVVLITSTSTILTVIAGITLLKERENISRKIVAALIVVIGALLLK
ncbi:MAG: Uncharacterized protein G01um101416_182 [Microgenomates group bacterium Gr01-1014_16]|nr:MAG: Uncharacterized protein G01um101416_182 [Microgenomates group bacterium Gr01-1014_16]